MTPFCNPHYFCFVEQPLWFPNSDPEDVCDWAQNRIGLIERYRLGCGCMFPEDHNIHVLNGLAAVVLLERLLDGIKRNLIVDWKLEGF